MSRDHTGEALMRLRDEEIRSAVARGDTQGLGDLDLTETEQAMVIAAADDVPEVEGFGILIEDRPNPLQSMLDGGNFASGPFHTAIRYSVGR